VSVSKEIHQQSLEEWERQAPSGGTEMGEDLGIPAVHVGEAVQFVTEEQRRANVHQAQAGADQQQGGQKHAGEAGFREAARR